MNTTNNAAAPVTFALDLGPTITFSDSEAAAVRGDSGAWSRRCFALVCPSHWGRADWKEQVSAVLTNADLERAGVTLNDVLGAVMDMTATEATWRMSETLDGRACYIIQAAGYRRGPAA